MMSGYLLPVQYRQLLEGFLQEDLGQAGDITSQAIFSRDQRGQGVIVSRQTAVLSGIEVAAEVFRLIDPHFEAKACAKDGEIIHKGQAVMELRGSVTSLLAGERTALNLLGRMCAIATLTHEASQQLDGTNCRIAATRKTTPGLRLLEKYAVRCGGGMTHRYRLDDAVLIKDNHVAFAGGVVPAVSKARQFVGHLCKIELEVDSLAQFQELIASGLAVDVVLLDNFSPEQIKQAVHLRQSSHYPVVLEASGGIQIANLRDYAAAGVDVISLGMLTHSAKNIDLGLDIL